MVSRLAKAHLGSNDTAILYCKDCYGPTIKRCAVLRLQKGKWHLEVWTLTLANLNGDRIKRSRRQRHKVSDAAVDGLISRWKARGFMSLSDDSLNKRWKLINDSTQLETGVSDGCSDNFHVIAGTNRKTISVSNADFFQNFVAVEQRRTFIDCRNMLFHLVDNTVERTIRR